MSIEINHKKVADVVVRCNEALSTGTYNFGEVIIGLGELIGKVIVEASQGPLQCKELTKVVVEHLDRTIHIGAEARQKQRIILPE
jgi:hypothetical protein